LKILLLTKKFPFPLKDGESVAVHGLSGALTELGCAIDLLSMNTSKHFVELDDVKSKVSHYADIQTSKVDNKIKLHEAVLNIFSGKSYHISRFDYKDYHRKLSAKLRASDFDVIFLETIYLAPYIETIRKYSSAPIVLRSHNVEHEIWQRIAANLPTGAKKAYLNMQVRRLRKYELTQLQFIDGLVTLTTRDEEYFQKAGMKKPSLVSPIGIDVSKYTTPYETDNYHELAFIGSLDWAPNIEGLDWFLEYVWPLIVKENPEAIFHIAGRNPSAELQGIKIQNVVIHGEVADAAEYVKSYPIAIVPLLSGGGMRVKILEAMALSRAIVSTGVGAEGINTESILLADKPQDFATAVLEILGQPKKIKQLGQQAYSDVKNNFDLNENTIRVYNFIKKLTHES